MIELYKTDNLLEPGFFNFEHSKTFLSDTDLAGIQKVKGIGFYFKEDDIESTEFRHFFKSFNRMLLEENDVYWVLAEIYPKKRNRVRSKRLMFYEERKELGEESVLEKEVEFNGGETIIIGAAELTEENLDYCMNKLFNDYFSFGYVINKSKNRFRETAGQKFETIVKEFSNSDKQFQANYLKLAGFLLEEGALIYRVALDGKSNQILEVYGPEKDIEKLEGMVEGRLNEKYYFRRMWKVSSH